MTMTALTTPAVPLLHRDDIAARADAAAEVAALHAADVDLHARFPREAVDALRANGLLGILVPVHLGGAGATYAEVAAVCTRLGRACSSTAMIYAMHQIQVACLVEHGVGSAHFEALMRRVVTDGALIASATTEAGIGGDVRSSICAVETVGDRFSLDKQASVVSYGAYVDDVLVTARRSPDAPASDQVLVHATRPGLRLTPTSEWDSMGMRGTCSIGFELHAEGPVDAILPAPYADVSGTTMLPVSHILWGAAWLGIAEDATDRARAFVRASARRTPGSLPPGARHLAELSAELDRSRAHVAAALQLFEEARRAPDLAGSMAFAVRMNNVKLAMSASVADLTQRAMFICGFAGYSNQSPFSVARHVRDAMSAALMVHNDRIVEHNAMLSCVMKDG
jgi:acyl-CoA dehydrogenase